MSHQRSAPHGPLSFVSMATHRTSGHTIWSSPPGKLTWTPASSTRTTTCSSDTSAARRSSRLRRNHAVTFLNMRSTNLPATCAAFRRLAYNLSSTRLLLAQALRASNTTSRRGNHIGMAPIETPDAGLILPDVREATCHLLTRGQPGARRAGYRHERLRPHDDAEVAIHLHEL